MTAPDVSVLFTSATMASHPDPGEPRCFGDLNLDQLIEAVTAGREDYVLTPYFHLLLPSVEEVRFRQEAFRDLERPDLLSAVRAFGQSMHDMRICLTQARQMHHQLQQSRWFLTAAGVYCAAVESLEHELAQAGPSGAALLALSDCLTALVSSAAHRAMREDARLAEDSLAEVTYTLQIRGSRIRVSAYEGEADYSQEVRATFRKFEQPERSARPSRFPALPQVDYVEGGILDRVARVFPAAFQTLSRFFDQHQGFVDPVMALFDREIQFYLGYLDYIEPLQSAGLTFCYPKVSEQSTEIAVTGAFDLVLAAKLVADQQPVVCNDVRLSGPERLTMVTGPNQGGKTTYARAFGQLHYLAGLGCPIPGTSAALILPDEIFTHFERAEDIETLSGKLQDDLIRLHQILQDASGRSIIILNEIFTSTTLTDALALSNELLAQVAALDAVCLCVTFLDELATFNPQTVSLVASIDPGNLAERTYKVVRRPADGLAYADAVADKHGLSYNGIVGRVHA